MTTIAYKDGIIACDSQCTKANLKKYDFNKIKKIKGIIFVFYGEVPYFDELAQIFFGNLKPQRWHKEVGAVVINKGVKEICTFVVSEYKTGLIEEWDIKSHYSVGSGSELAIGAMDAGATAIEAVKIATERDIYSGGKVRFRKLW